MRNQNLELFLTTQLILEYRASLETISKIFNMEQSEMYAKVMQTDSEIIRYALMYVFDYETSVTGLINQDNAKKQIRMFLTKLQMAKSAQEKLNLIKSLDNSADVIKLSNKKAEDYDDNDFEAISKYRYKYALPKSKIHEIFGLTRAIVDNREKKMDEDLKNRLDVLNQYNNRFSYYTHGGRTR